MLCLVRLKLLMQAASNQETWFREQTRMTGTVPEGGLEQGFDQRHTLFD
jgi:hypothetical protein